jgi:hypothetical protein
MESSVKCSQNFAVLFMNTFAQNTTIFLWIFRGMLIKLWDIILLICERCLNVSDNISKASECLDCLRDSLVRIWIQILILGSVPLTNGSGCRCGSVQNLW